MRPGGRIAEWSSATEPDGSAEMSLGAAAMSGCATLTAPGPRLWELALQAHRGPLAVQSLEPEAPFQRDRFRHVALSVVAGLVPQ